MNDMLDIEYDTACGEAVNAYYSRDRSLCGTDERTKEILATGRVPVIIDYGEGDEEAGADAMDMTARIRVQATGDDGIADLRYGTEFYVVDPGGRGNYWQVTNARKSADGLEWICECSRLRRPGEET